MEMAQMTWVEIKGNLPRRPLILPLGAVEAHGPHLPVGTDNYIAEELSRRLAAKIDGLVLPVQPWGQVWSLQNFPGTISLAGETVKNTVKDIAVSLNRHGGRVLLIVNGHLGNRGLLKDAVRELREENLQLKVLTMNHPGLQELEEKYLESPRALPGFFHAEEIETSILLAIKPELVKMELARPAYPEIPAYHSAYPLRWEQFTPDGVLGDPRPATAQKGEKILAGLVEMMVKIYREFREGELE